MEKPVFFWPRTKFSTEIGVKNIFYKGGVVESVVEDRGRNSNDLEMKVKDLTKM
jgi:hypothetical protein